MAFTPEPVERPDGALDALLHAAAELELRLAGVCSRHGITYEQYAVLGLLREAHPEGLARGVIADRLLARAPDVTRLIDRLERDGLVVRERDARDRRLSLAVLAYEGTARLRDMEADVRRVRVEFAAALEAGELERLGEMCRSLLRAQPAA